jgi:hypothetical protein
LLFGAPVWAEKMRLGKYADILLRAQRMMLLTVCKGYRTVSRDALQVLAGVMPIDIKAMERNDLYRARITGIGNRRDIRVNSMRKWQDRWDASETGRSTHMLLPNVEDRLGKRLEMTHFNVQFLTGHGNFGAYLKRFGLRESDLCEYCGVVDTPEHVLYDCEEIAESRTQLRVQLMDIGARWTSESLWMTTAFSTCGLVGSGR